MKITQDIHIHTHYSLCAKSDATPQFYIDNAATRGLNLIGFSDHMWDLGNGSALGIQPNLEYILQVKNDLAKCTIPDNLRVLVGCETDILSDSTLGISRDVAKQLDFVLVSQAHTHFFQVCPPQYQKDRRACMRFCLDAFKRLMNHPDADLITAVPHPLSTHYANQNGGDSDLLEAVSDAEFKEAFLLAAEKNIGIEINAHTVKFACDSTNTDANDLNQLKNLQLYRMFSLAKEVGCKFTFGSDAHDQYAVSLFWLAQAMADALDLTEDNLLLL